MIYTIENPYLQVKVSSIGCTLMSLIDKRTNTDIVLGFDREEDYIINNDQHLGAVVGRNANRIGKGHFKLNNKDIYLSLNCGPNNLHSGLGDLSFRGYKLIRKTADTITLGLEDYDMSGGLPGNLTLEVTYTLKKNSLIFSYSGICDQDSILNMTNHAYFNLNGGVDNICSHELKLYTDKVSLNDNDGMATAQIMQVADTSFDFREYQRISDNLSLKDPNLSGGGFDHNFVFENLEDKEIASLRNGKLILDVSSDMPDVHVYTANYLGDLKGKNNLEYHNQYGIAIECDYYPNGINYEGIIKPIIKANEKVSHYIKYTISDR